MPRTLSLKLPGRLARLAALGVGALLLAGCVTGYGFVQTDGGGGYYTSSGPYSGYYSAESYSVGSVGYGYYGGGSPYWGSYAYYGGSPYYSVGFGYGYQPWIGFGIGSVYGWGYPGYWQPWYASGYPVGGCYGYGCGHWRGHHHYYYADHDDHGGSQPGPQPGHPFVPPPRRPWSGPPPVSMESNMYTRVPRAGAMDRRAFGSATFAPNGMVRAPARLPAAPGFTEMAARPAYVSQSPAAPAFIGQRAQPMAAPAVRSPSPSPSFRPAPVPVAPAAKPIRRNGDTPEVQIR